MMKYALGCLNLVLLVLAVYLGAGLVNREPVQISQSTPAGNMPEQGMTGRSGSETSGTKPGLSEILKRNLFKAASSKGKDQPKAVIQKKLEPTTLKLVLRGTVEGENASYAVIEDPKKRKQGLYRRGDKVAGAKIMAVSRNRVVLRYKGKDQLLETKTQPNTGARKGDPAPQLASLKLPELTGQLEKFEVPRDQARFRPFFSGKQRGLLVYGVNPASGFYRAGLKNGDVVTHVDNKTVQNLPDARYIQKALASGENVRLGILRRGHSQTIEYNAVTQEATLVE